MKPTVLVDNTYAYDNNANRIEKRTLAGLNRFAYDSVNRLVKAEYPTGAAVYRYDKAGNRTQKTWTGADAVTAMEERYHYDSCNRLTSRETMQGDTSQQSRLQYQYDAQGNMLSDGNRQFTYDAMNRLSEVRNEDGSFQRNRYDGEGLRTELEENGRLVSFLFDGDKVVSEKEEQNTIRYIRGYELISSDSEKARTYYHCACDEMGSITHVTDEAGSVLNRYEYDAFGECTSKEETVANRFGFAGEQYDPVAGMYYLRARFCNPVIGRFIQEDTYYGDGLNLYAYCHNNPVGYVDPSGHARMCADKEEAIHILEEHVARLRDVEAEYLRLRGIHGSAAEVRRWLVSEYGPSRFESGYALRPNREFNINGYTYRTDANGRLISATGDLHLEDGVRNQAHQLQAGGADRRRGDVLGGPDDGGHLIATIFGGSGLVDNMVAMNYNLNRGAYKAMENKWAAILANAPTANLNVKISVIYSGNSMRPEQFKITYYVDGRRAGSEIFDNEYGGGM